MNSSSPNVLSPNLDAIRRKQEDSCRKINYANNKGPRVVARSLPKVRPAGILFPHDG